MNCLLCLEVDVKFAKAHIIPKALYGKTVGPQADTVMVSSKADTRLKRSRVGEYDSNILCLNCEKKYSLLDQRAVKTFIDEEPEIFSDRIEPLYATYTNADAEGVLAFFQFLTWRIGSSSRPMFSRISLGPYQEKLRNAVIHKDTTLCPEFDVVLSRFDRKEHAILSPSRLRIDGINGYRIVFAGHTSWVKLDRRPFPENFSEIALSSGPTVRAMCQKFSNSAEFRAMKSMVESNTELKTLSWGNWGKVNSRLRK